MKSNFEKIEELADKLTKLVGIEDPVMPFGKEKPKDNFDQIIFNVSYGTAGFAAGYLTSKGGRIFALVAGCSLLLLPFIKPLDFVKVNESKVEKEVRYITDKIKGSDREVRKVEKFVKENFTTLSCFFGGFCIGYAFG